MTAVISEFLEKHIKEMVEQVRIFFLLFQNNNNKTILKIGSSSHMQDTPEADEDCLLYYSREWANYRWSSNILNNVCRYLNEQKLRRDSTAYTIEQIAFKVWREEVFNNLHEKVSKAALEMLERNRSGEIINTIAIKDVVQSHIELGSLEKRLSPMSGKDSENLTVNN